MGFALGDFLFDVSVVFSLLTVLIFIINKVYERLVQEKPYTIGDKLNDHYVSEGFDTASAVPVVCISQYRAPTQFQQKPITELQLADFTHRLKEDSRNRDKVQVILTKLKQILLKADVVSFLLYYYFEDTLDDMSEIYENCVSCKLWIWDISYFSLHIVCRQILVQVAPRWIPNIPLRLSLMKNVRGRYIELFGINFLLYGVVSYNCSVIVGYFSVYYESWTANILVGLTILIAVIRNIKRNEFCYTQFLIYTLILHTNVKQVFGICGKITIDMNSTLLKTVIFSEKVGDGVMVIRIGLGDILMVCSFAALFLETDFGYWGNVFRKIRLMLQNKYMQNDNERDMKCGPESAEKDQPSSFARMPTDLEKTNLKSPKASELSKPSEEPQVLDLSNKNPKNTIKGKKKMIEGKWVHVNYC